MMKSVMGLALTLLLAAWGCTRQSPDAVTLQVDFSWQDLKPCGWGNPAIQFSGVPEGSRTLVIGMYDHAYSHDHGRVTVPYAGQDRFEKDRFREIQGPCPSWTPGRYEITITALNADGVVIGIGRRERPFPE